MRAAAGAGRFTESVAHVRRTLADAYRGTQHGGPSTDHANYSSHTGNSSHTSHTSHDLYRPDTD